MNAVEKRDDYADFRLNLVLRKIGQNLLLDVLKFAVPKPNNASYFEHLSEESSFSSKYFDTSQKQKLKNDYNGSSFDISLLFKLYVHGCSKVCPQSDMKWRTAGEFEYYLGAIKRKRNDLVHSTTPIKYESLKCHIVDIGTLFRNFLTSAQIRFQIPDHEAKICLEKVEKDLRLFSDAPLNQSDVDEYLASEAIVECKARYKKMSFINPVDFFIGLEFSTKIDDIFVTLEIKELGNYEEGHHIHSNDILDTFKKNDVSVLIIEGLAGSGKTTLSKYILSQWVDSTIFMAGLNDFELVLYLQCNNTYINSIHDLIASIMPETYRKFKKDELIEAIFSKNLLVIADGIDEAHGGSKSVIKEMFYKAYTKNIKFLCTTRPERIPWVYRIKGDLCCGTFSIIGISKRNRTDFVRQLYGVYEKNISNKYLYPLNSVMKILERLSSSFLINDLKLPLFLALFTYLCTVEPRKMESINSVVSLYNELIVALKDRLFLRSIARYETTTFDYDEDEITEAINECLTIICFEAYIGIKENCETLSTEAMNKIREHSSVIGLPIKDILSAFFVVKVILTPLGMAEVVGFPHKGLKEYLAAKSIVKLLKQKKGLLSIFNSNNELDSKKPKQLDLNTSLIQYQNLILYLSGILVMENMLTEELVNEILKLFRKAGVYHARQWVNILKSLDFHYLACEFILMKFKQLEFDDDQLEALLKLLKNGCPQEIVIKINSAEFHHLQMLKNILSQLQNYECNLKLMMAQFFKAPKTRNSSDMINILCTKTSRCNLSWFQGSLEEYGIRRLPESLRVLSLGIGTEKQAKALKHLNENSDIMFLKIHIERSVNPADLSKICDVFDFFLFLSGVKSTFSDITWAVDVISRLSSSKKYGKLLFPSSSLDTKSIYKLLKELQKLNLPSIGSKTADKKGGIYVASSSVISAADLGEFKGFCLRVWKCPFVLVSEEEIWRN